MASQSDIHFDKVYGVLSCTRRLKEVPETVTYLLVGVDNIVQAGLGKVKCFLDWGLPTSVSLVPVQAL